MPSLWNIFIPTETGFELVENITGNGSINSVSEHLGYGIKPSEIYTFWNNYDEGSDIQYVALEMFSKNIAYIATQSHIKSIDKKQLYHFLEKLTDREIYDSYTVEDKLKEAIEARSFTIDFLAKSLELDTAEDNGIYYSDKLGMYLYFENGILTDFQGADGLGIWAKTWKQVRPDLLEQYQMVATYYWGDNLKAALNEINTQATAWANTPETLNNKFIDLHTDSLGIVNFEMLLVCHYNKAINLHDFLLINHGRYEKIVNESSADSSYKLGFFLYVFNSAGNLFHITVA
jgi:hypothetical protein